MKLQWTSHFAQAYSKAPKEIQAAFDKQSSLLLQNLRHPSLHAKKYDEAKGRWQARVTRDWRSYFLIQGDIYILLDIIPHPK
jgi:mRNA-degrading endonuclease RelE of RelBE toxin-antitoxin system